MTPRQVLRHLRAASRRLEREEQSRRWHTWHAAALPNLKSFPKFDEFVKPRKVEAPRRRRKQTADEQIGAFKAIMAKRRR